MKIFFALNKKKIIQFFYQSFEHAFGMKGEMKSEFDDLNKRHNLTRHDIWAVESPNGLMAVVLHEGPGADSFMQNVAVSENSFDISLKNSIKGFHGMDLDLPPPGPMPVKLV